MALKTGGFSPSCFGPGWPGAAEMDLFKAERFQGGPWRIRAETLTYDAANHLYVARGRVEIIQGDRRITADQAQVDEVTKVATLTGNVVMVMEGEVLHCRKKGPLQPWPPATASCRTPASSWRGAISRVAGKFIRRTGDNTYFAEKATVTTCRRRPSGMELLGSAVVGVAGRLCHRQGCHI